ncbi:MAG: carboxypeptidase regulatory-like domain-containing protein [Gemmatimonadaceae bacterium]
MMTRSSLAFAAAVVIAPALQAQSVRGRVVSVAGDAPVPGVVVSLLDSTDAAVTRALSDASGRYELDAPRPGRYRIRTQRIGFRPVTSAPLQLATGANVERQLALSAIAFSLDTVRVAQRSVCGSMGDSAAAIFAMWEQARTALYAAQLTSRARGLNATVESYEHTMDPRARTVTDETRQLSSGFVTAPWRSPSIGALRREGYVVQDEQGWTTYRVPGLDVLASDAFVQDHCFRIVRTRDNRDIGLAFQPTRDRRETPEIRGTIWLDRASSELRRVEFGYVNITSEQEGEAGGDVEFARLSDGGWAISRWNVRMPVLEQLSMGGRTQLRVAEVRVAGGDLTVATRGSDTLWARGPVVAAARPDSARQGRRIADVSAALAGRVLSGAASPLVDAEVLLPDLQRSEMSAADGSFRMGNIPPGRHRVTVRKVGFAAVDTAFVFSERDTVRRHFVLARAAVLDTVRARAIGVIPSFDQHRELGRGHFFTRDTLEKMTNRTLSSILSELPGARVVPTGRAGAILASRRRSMATLRPIEAGDPRKLMEQGFCPAAIFINGQAAYRGEPGEPVFDLNTFSPDAIEAIEYYSSPASIPPRYAGKNTECGVLVIHTRRAAR